MSTAEHHLLRAIQLEARGELQKAISSYKQAYRLKPELEFQSSRTIVVDGVEYNDKGERVDVKFCEQDGTFSEPDLPTPFTPRKFHVGDPDLPKFLEENGYVVVRSEMSQSELEEAKSLFWDFVESYSRGLINRDDPSTWTDDKWPGDHRVGFITANGVGQCEFMWYLRSLPNIKAAFAQIWGDDDLLVSFDGCGSFRPIEYDRSWRTFGGWYHVDQNCYQKPGRCCIQGLFNLFPSGENDGGAVVVPRSHKMVESAFGQNKIETLQGDYVRFERNEEFWKEEELLKSTNPEKYAQSHALEPVKLCLDAGDFMMWDSRTIHCNHPPTKMKPRPDRFDLARLTAYICMSPSSQVKDLPALISRRIAGLRAGLTTSHWPTECGEASQIYESPVVLNAEQSKLVTGNKYTGPTVNKV